MSKSIIPGHSIVKQLGKGTYGEVFLTKTKWDSTKVYLIMEYVAGGDLSKFIREKRHLPENLVRHFLRQLDFGFAQWQKDSAKRNELRGTLLYMAPEVYCEGFYHPSCDLWSVGVILHGQHPPFSNKLTQLFRISDHSVPHYYFIRAEAVANLKNALECLFGLPPYASTDIQSLQARIIKDEPIQLPDSIPISENCAALLLGLLKRRPTERLDHEAFFNHPFVDLKHAPVAESLDQAISLLSTAHQLTCRGQLKEAYEHYTQGLSYLLSTIQCETASAKRTELLQVAEEYFKQAEQVKTRIQKEDNAKGPTISPPRRPPALRKCELTNGPGPLEPEIVMRKDRPVMHKPPGPDRYAASEVTPKVPIGAPPTPEPPISPSASQNSFLDRLRGFFSTKHSDEIASKVSESAEAAEDFSHQPETKTDQVKQDDVENRRIPDSLNPVVCAKSPDGVSTQPVAHPKSREPLTRPPAPLPKHSPKRHHRRSAELGGSENTATVNQSDSPHSATPSPESSKAASTVNFLPLPPQLPTVGHPEPGSDSLDLIDLHTVCVPSATAIPSGVAAPGSDSDSDRTVDCLTNPPQSLTRLRALSMDMKFPSGTAMKDQQTARHASDQHPPEGVTDMREILSLFTERSKLPEIKRMYSPDDSCPEALIHLEELYALLRSNRPSEASSRFELNFQRCLELAKADSNEPRRRALHSELKLVLDLVERIRSQLSTESPSKSDSSTSSTDFCQLADEVGIEATESVEDNCTIS